MEKNLLIYTVIILVVIMLIFTKPKVNPAVVAKAKTEFDAYILEASAQFHVPVKVIVGVICTESSADKNVRDGSVGEIGLMQIRPDMALIDVNRVYKLGFTANDLRDPRKNIIAGTAYLHWIEHYFFPNDWKTVIRAYNCGVGTAKYIPIASITYFNKVTAYGELYA